MNDPILIYTDGSCHTQHRIGGWAYLVIAGNERKYLTGTEAETTHNRMEIIAVLEAIYYTTSKYGYEVEMKIYSDSQYVIQLPGRFASLQAKNFVTKKGTAIQNEDLVKKLMEVLAKIKYEFIKVKAHQHSNDIPTYNIEVDRLAREMVRKSVKEAI